MTDNATQHMFFCSDELWNSLINMASSKGRSVDDVIIDALQAMLQKEASDVRNIEPPPAPTVPVQDVIEPAPIPQPQSTVPPVPPLQAYSRQPIPPHQGRQPSSYNSPQVPSSYAAITSVPGLLQGSSQNPGQSQSISPAPPIQSYASASQSMQAASANNYHRSPSNYDIPGMYGSDSPRMNSSSIPPVQQHLGGSGYQSAQSIPSQQAMQISGQPPLYIVFANQRYTVDKDKFIIGRSSQLADLVIRDGNISRKHCAIIYKGGAYYIKDLDSTNGIEYKGQRIDTKRIDEGDVFNICEFQFSFTYHSK